MKYSIIIPVFNRPQEVEELLESLSKQSYKDFDILIVEDGSTEKCEDIVQSYSQQLNIKYFFKENSGPGDSRNFGMAKATGEYLIFFDSDCIIPPDYFKEVTQFLETNPLDTYGGPDAAHPSFSDVQKAIDYSMTSFFTTGGIRGRKKQLDKFQPRSFNMGIKKEVYNHVGGFGKIHPGEDPDLSYRIMEAGYKTGLIPDAHVFHKRRIDFSKFLKQVYKFGVVRIILSKWHKGTLKLVYFLPTVFLLGNVFLLLMGLFVSSIFLVPLLLFMLLIFFDALRHTKNLKVALLAVPASIFQLCGYGFGFLQSFLKVKLLGQQEQKAFPNMFFD